MNMIEEFCKNSETVSINSTRVSDIFSHKFDIDINNDEVYRDRNDVNGSFIFDIELNLKDNSTPKEEIELMKTIELFYPKMFSWRFNGQHIECLARIPLDRNSITLISRYRGEYGFIELLRDRFLEILKYRGDVLITSKKIKPYIISTGSINNNNNTWVVDISPNDSLASIFIKTNSRILTSPRLKLLSMKYWIRELNPDFYREYKKFINVKKYQLCDGIMSKYPPCIQKLMSMKTKGNYVRFLLATFLLGVHGERDAKHQLDLILSITEREHMNTGNCKDQWRAILSRKYSAPSCKTLIENGYCSHRCTRYGLPTNLEVEAKEMTECK